MSGDMKPCPFCGGDGRLCHYNEFEWFVECDQCDACSHTSATEKGAMNAWNFRVI